MSTCPNEERLVALVELQLGERESAELHRHIQTCSSCSLVFTLLIAKPLDSVSTAPAATNGTQDDEPACAASEQAAPRGPTDDEPLQRGQLVGSYVVLRKLGQGGMGIVYEALQTRIRRRAAIKVMRRSVSAHRQTAHRFLMEARAANAVSHPGIVSIFEMGELADGSPYIVMEYLHGQSLRERLQQLGRLPWSAAALLGQQIADTLAAAHAQQVVHRDLKPDNVMIVADAVADGGERIKLLDFGLAKLRQESDASSSLLTQSSATLGTPIYMAPELIGGARDAEPASDVYALGVTLFELLAGRPPFIATTASQMYAMHLRDAPAVLSELVDEQPVELHRLIDRMLAKSPAERPTMREVATALAALSHQVGPRPVSPLRLPLARREGQLGRVARWGIAAGCTIVGLVLLGLAWQQRVHHAARMVALPGGTFNMGSSPEEVDAAFAWCQRLSTDGCYLEKFQREVPARSVLLSPFFLDETEVTTERFVGWLRSQPNVRVEDQRLVVIGGARILDLYPTFDQFGVEWSRAGFSIRRGYDRKPITQVTWEGAQLYCQAQGKRLPTEAEWEYAARGAHGWRFPWGSEEPSCEGVVFARRPNYACAQLQTGPSDVGHAAQDRSPQGVRDLAGNVAEWVSDSYVEHYPVCDAPCVDPWVETPDARATQAARVIRGGDYNVAAPLTRAAWRGRWPHDYSTGNIGFRCARSAAR